MRRSVCSCVCYGSISEIESATLTHTALINEDTDATLLLVVSAMPLLAARRAFCRAKWCSLTLSQPCSTLKSQLLPERAQLHVDRHGERRNGAHDTHSHTRTRTLSHLHNTHTHAHARTHSTLTRVSLLIARNQRRNTRHIRHTRLKLSVE
jgi:hypothetical protein